MMYRDRSGLVVNYIQYRNGEQVDDHEEPSAFCCSASNLLWKIHKYVSHKFNLHPRKPGRCKFRKNGNTHCLAAKIILAFLSLKVASLFFGSSSQVELFAAISSGASLTSLLTPTRSCKLYRSISVGVGLDLLEPATACCCWAGRAAAAGGCVRGYSV